MRISSTRAVVAVLLASVAIPALGQDSRGASPESILPPGFGDTPAPAPSPRAAPPPPTAPATPRSPVSVTPRPLDPDVPVATALPLPGATPTPGALPAATDFAAYVQADMPDYARRSLGLVGVAGPAEGAMAPDAFGTADGRFLEGLMRRLKAPIASRWVSIALRRALLARVDTPRGVNGSDFAAERAWLLVRMGESVGARALVQAVDNDRYTPKMYQAAMQAALATGDPAALCPTVEAGAKQGLERGWVLARAMCAGLAGQPGRAQPMIAAARKSGLAGGIDLLLAQKVAGTGARGRQAVTIEWDNVEMLSAWRYGLATATAVDIPDALLNGAAPAVQGWRALSPALALPARARVAELAAARGILSNAALVDLYAAIDAGDDDSIAEAGIARDLQAAYAGPDRATRREALRRLWDEPRAEEAYYGRLVLTARAATHLPTDTKDADVDRLVATMLSAGLDRAALRWRGLAPRGGDAWAMLALADPAFASYSYGDVGSYAGKDDPDGLKERMLFAGLAGLSRMPVAEVERAASSLGVPIGRESSWTRAIGRAAQAHQPGTVVLLAATAMQTRRWRGVAPEALYHIMLALRAVGMQNEARMIAVEALTRVAYTAKP